MKEPFWDQLKSAEFPRGNSDSIALLPIGSMEQHGPHLPVGVDNFLVSEVARRAAVMIGSSKIHVLPTVWVSMAEHHMSFPGTLSLNFDVFSALIRNVASSLKRQGLTRIFLLNGHGGNVAPLSVIVGEFTAQTGIALVAATYWILAQKEFDEILEAQPNLRHACEAETSMMLALHPDLVDRAKIDPSSPAEGLIEDLSRARDIRRWSANGVVGSPHLATPEKGEQLLAAAARALASRLADDATWSG